MKPTWLCDVHKYLQEGSIALYASTSDCLILAKKAIPFTLIYGLLHCHGIDMNNRKVLQPLVVDLILKKMHMGGGHFSEDITSQKILNVGNR